MIGTEHSKMTVGVPKKFLFDTNFGQGNEPQTIPDSADLKDATDANAEIEDVKEEAPPPQTFSEEDLARARDEGFQAGREETVRDMASALEQQQSSTLDAIDAKISDFLEDYRRNNKEHNRDAVAVATTIVRKLFPSMNMDNALVEIEHMVIEAMKRTSGAPTLIVRVAPDLQATIETKIQDLAAQRGHEGIITVMADETLDPGDAKVEWDGGAMVRDTQTMWNDIDEIIERNLGTQTDDLSPNIEQGPEQDTEQDPEQDTETAKHER